MAKSIDSFTLDRRDTGTAQQRAHASAVVSPGTIGARNADDELARVPSAGKAYRFHTAAVRCISRAPLRHWIGGIVIIALACALLAWMGTGTLRTYHDELLYDLGAHLTLVAWSMLGALVTGIPAGIVLSRAPFQHHAERVMQVFNVGNTIPSLAVLVLALAVLGIGDGPAILALWLASVLPITRNTYEGLRQVPAAMREAAKGVGMTPMQSLLRAELPNAAPMMLGGVRTALAVNVGTAPLAFLIGADSLGTLIFPGIYLDNPPLLLLGAVATAVLALVLDAVVVALGRCLPGCPNAIDRSAT